MGPRTVAASVVVAAVAVVAGTAALKAPTHACVSRGGLPDAACTPGALNPQVTQQTIGRTVCVRGWTATIRPPASYTTALKRTQMKAYGDTGPTSAYEEDHLISLELGGNPTDPRNLWPEPWAGARGAHAKDLIENALKRAVCAGRMTLAAAQHRIATDWTKGATP